MQVVDKVVVDQKKEEAEKFAKKVRGARGRTAAAAHGAPAPAREAARRDRRREAGS